MLEVRGVCFMTLAKEKVFAEGFGFKKLFLIFVIGSIFGALYEQILNLVKVYTATGDIVWELRRGVIYGPFSPIYGAGAVLIVYLFARKNYSNLKTFIYGALFGGIFEYAISFLQETFTHTTSWDYSSYFLNINGRTTIPYMIVWGLFTLVFVKGVYPFLSKWIEMIPVNVGNVCFNIILVFLIIDMTVSWTALIRSAMRRSGIDPITPVGEIYDKVYPDSVLAKSFPNMDFKVSGK